MNRTSIKSAFSSLSFRCRLYRAVVNVARYKHSVAHINNRDGKPIIAVRYNVNNGFTFLDKLGNDITELMLSNMKSMV